MVRLSRNLCYFIGGQSEENYKKAWKNYLQAREHTKNLEVNLIKKQERYIRREQEYRKTIEEIQNEIKTQSMNPFRIEGKGGDEEKEEDEKPITFMPGQKSQEIVTDYKEIIEIIDQIQVNTAKMLLNQKKDFCKLLNEKHNNLQK